jgi:hypothetical protein
VKALLESQISQIRDRLDAIVLMLAGYKYVEGVGASRLSAALAGAELAIRRVLKAKRFSLGVRFTTAELHPSKVEKARESLWTQAGEAARRAAGFLPVKKAP